MEIGVPKKENVHKRIRIIGAGPGAPEYFSLAGRRAAQESDIVVGSQRLLELVSNHPMRRVAGPAVESTLAAISSCAPEKTVSVLVSGDPGLLSLARLVIARFGRFACEVIPGISSLQVAFARVALDWYDAKVVDAHGSAPELSPSALAAEAKTAIFLGSARAASWLSDLSAALRSSHALVACSHLTQPNEYVREVLPENLPSLATAPSTVLLVLRKDLWQ